MSDSHKCDKCGSRLRTVSSRAVGNEQLRYLRCGKCGTRCRAFVKADAIWRRSK